VNYENKTSPSSSPCWNWAPDINVILQLWPSANQPVEQNCFEKLVVAQLFNRFLASLQTEELLLYYSIPSVKRRPWMWWVE
jgi:hypothetical protein